MTIAEVSSMIGEYIAGCVVGFLIMTLMFGNPRQKEE